MYNIRLTGDKVIKCTICCQILNLPLPPLSEYFSPWSVFHELVMALYYNLKGVMKRCRRVSNLRGILASTFGSDPNLHPTVVGLIFISFPLTSATSRFCNQVKQTASEDGRPRSQKINADSFGRRGLVLRGVRLRRATHLHQACSAFTSAGSGGLLIFRLFLVRSRSHESTGLVRLILMLNLVLRNGDCVIPARSDEAV